MRVLLTGASGQLGRRLQEALQDGGRLEVAAFDRALLDVADPSQVHEVARGVRPAWIVNCAAYTDVDGAELHPEEAYRVNDRAVGHLADAASEVGARLLHVSTDYVFSGWVEGEPRRPYHERDDPGPLSVYAASKRAGEARLEAHPVRSLVVRTSWLYGGPGGSFLGAILRAGRRALEEGKPLRVVNDQRGSPTDTWSLALQLRRLLSTDLCGLVHASCSGEATWLDLARAIFERAGIAPTLEPTTLQAYGGRARRPLYTVLECRRLGALGLLTLPSWREALATSWARLDGGMSGTS